MMAMPSLFISSRLTGIAPRATYIACLVRRRELSGHSPPFIENPKAAIEAGLSKNLKEDLGRRLALL
jgi:hypothetical protein